MSETTTAARIYANIFSLLNQGTFSGNAAEALVEAKRFIAEMHKELTKQIEEESREQEEEGPEGQSSGTEKHTSGVASSDVSHPKRKSRPRRSNRT